MIYVAKTKALISCTVTAQLICTFVFAYAKSRFSHDAAQMKGTQNLKKLLHFPKFVSCNFLKIKQYYTGA